MANDRIYLRCKKCGAYVKIAKYWGLHYNKVISEDSLDYWLDSHASCTKDGMTVDNLELLNEAEVVKVNPERHNESVRLKP